MRCLLTCLLLSIIHSASGQNDPASSFRVLTFSPDSPIHIQDTLLIDFQSIKVFSGDQPIEFTLLMHNNHHAFQIEIPKQESQEDISVSYRVILKNIQQKLQNRSEDLILDPGKEIYIGQDYNPYQEEPSIVRFNNLNYLGSFDRGLSFGNNQSLVLNSNFNMQMAGKIGNGLELTAAISDNNIPVQPEGNTQEINDFDKVYIALSKGSNKLIAGDYELTKPPSYFMNYYKKISGLSFQQKGPLKNGQLSSQVSTALSKGKFSRNTLPVSEGNQGPYKLIGNEGERFIIIQSGSEKVWIDDQLLVRGANNDYTIDYNSSEIRFTSNRMITKDSRVVIEFEYVEQSFQRSLIAANSLYESDNWTLGVNFYNEQDAKNVQGDLILTDADIEILRNAGDSLQLAKRPGHRLFDPENDVNRPLYFQKDSLDNNGMMHKIWVHSTDMEKAKYIVQFSNVGQEKGNYVHDALDQNGRIYKWVSPDDAGLPMGTYEPIIPLQAPQKKQMITAKGSFKNNRLGEMSAEIALSNTDQNRISTINDQDNTNFAIITKYRRDHLLGKSENNWSAHSQLEYEYSQKGFSPLNPYRNAEFKRDWIIENEFEHAESTTKLNFGIKHAQDFETQYAINAFSQKGYYKGIKQHLSSKFVKSGYEVRSLINYLSSTSNENKSEFFRPNIQLSKTFSRLNEWQLGLNYDAEHKQIKEILSDTFDPQSAKYNQFNARIKSPENPKYGIEVSLQSREDQLIFQNQFKKANHAREIIFKGFWRQKAISNLQWQFNVRDLKIDNTDISSLDPQRNYLGKLQHQLNIKQGFILSNLLYELGSGQEPTLEFEFQEVDPGEGNFIYNDDNGDGIKQTWEFKPEIFSGDGNYIKRRVFTDQFIKTNQSILNWNLRTNLSKIIEKKNAISRFGSKLSMMNSIRINNRNAENKDNTWLLPFAYDLRDSAQVAVDASFRNTLFFNRSNPVYDFQIGQFKTQRKQQLSSGYIIQDNEEYFIKARWNITKTITWTPHFYVKNKQIRNEIFIQNDIDLSTIGLDNSLTLLQSSSFRLIFNHAYNIGSDLIASPKKPAKQNKLGLKSSLKPKGNSAYHVSFSFVDIKFQGQISSNIEYHLLSGLKVGQNYLWDINLDRSIGKNLILRIGYNGRKTGDNKAVHQGNAQIRASF